MKKILLTAGIALIATAGAVVAQAPEPAPATRPDRPDRNANLTRAEAIARADQGFARLDVNRDGRFTPEEAQQLRVQRRAQHAERMFDRIDANRDGSITREEMAQAQTQRAERREGGRHGRRGGHRGAPRHEIGGRMFGEQGFVTAEQMRERALARFDRVDADRNGTITAAERQQARGQMRERHRERMRDRPTG